jgi:RNA polymerase sigma factor (sigma-70 family)
MTGFAAAEVREISDTQLVEHGNRAFHAFRRRYRYSGPEAEDISQEIMVALVKARKRYRPEKGDWEAYAWKYARGAVRSYYREQITSNGVRQGRNGEAVRFVSHDDLLHEPGSEDIHWQLDEEDAFADLTTRERFIVLCLNAGYTKTEVARMLGINATKVGFILNRLRLGKLRSLNLRQRATRPLRSGSVSS